MEEISPVQNGLKITIFNGRNLTCSKWLEDNYIQWKKSHLFKMA